MMLAQLGFFQPLPCKKEIARTMNSERAGYED